jgi:hypothetical protein
MKRAGIAEGYIACALSRIESVRMARQQHETASTTGVRAGKTGA